MDRRKKFLTLTIIMFFGISVFYFNSSISIKDDQLKDDFTPIQIDNRPKLLDLTDPAFTIQGSADLGTYSIGGTGALGDPYQISGYRIDARGLPEGMKYLNTWGLHVDFFNNTILGGDNAALSIENVTADTVRVYENTFFNATYGIEFIDTDEHLVNFNHINGCLTGVRFTGDNYEMHNNTFIECDIGIEAETAYQAFLHNNTMIDCGYGIFTSGCISSIVNTNIISGSIDVGIYDRLSESTDIIYNHLYDNQIGIAINMSLGVILADNRIYNSISDGIFLQETEGTELWLNQLFGCGFNVYDRNITRASSIIFSNTNNYVNGRLAELYQGLSAYFITGNLSQLILINCSFLDVYGFDFFDSSNGLTMIGCEGIIFYDTSFFNIDYGIRLVDVDDIELDNCVIESGIQGISAFSSINLYINYCDINENDDVGIFFYDIIQAEIRDNYFINNTNFGISLETCSDVLIYHNDFIQNGNGTLPQCSDFYGATNYWYSETLSDGNYWTEYSGIGTYLIHCQFNDIFDLYPSGPIVISEYSAVPMVLLGITMLSFISIISFFKRR